MTHKAVILARGVGNRMRRDEARTPLSKEQERAAAQGLKSMIPIDRPFLDYIISALADAGISDVCLVIGPEHAVVREYYTQIALTRIRVRFAIQELPRGTADAVLAAEAFAGDDDVLVLNSDNYYPVEAYRTLLRHRGSGLIGFDAEALVRDSNIPQDRVRAFALLQTARGRLSSIVEKPDAETCARLAPSSLVSMNLWRFTPVIFRACREVTPSVRGELELVDAVRLAMTHHAEVFTVFPCAAGVLDLTSRQDIDAVAHALAGVTVRL